MADTNVVPVGNTDGSVESTDVKDVETITYNKDFVNKLLQEKKNAMLKVKELESKQKTAEDEVLKRNNEFKALYESEKIEKEKLLADNKAKDEKFNEIQKLSHLKKELLKLGINEKYLDTACKLAPLNEILIDPDTLSVINADKVAKSLQASATPFFQISKPGIDASAPVGSGPQLTLEIWKQLPPEEKIKRQEELYKNMGITRKK